MTPRAWGTCMTDQARGCKARKGSRFSGGARVPLFRWLWLLVVVVAGLALRQLRGRPEAVPVAVVATVAANGGSAGCGGGHRRGEGRKSLGRERGRSV